ncbi:MAG: SDR family NAD(P)-dependent oxidoreductase [Spirochaetia bacterium]
MEYCMLTGASRGLGEALARLMIERKSNLICLSRQRNPEIERLADTKGTEITWIECDLSKPGELLNRLDEIFPPPFKLGKINRIILINNAATIEPVGLAGTVDERKILAAATLNFAASAALCNRFIGTYRPVDWDKIILNITSGAADYVIPGLSLYCASKAGMDMLTRAIAREQERAEQPVRVAAVSPGMVDTSMQERIRSADPEHLPVKDRFVEAMEKGKVIPAEEAASGLIDFIESGFESGTVTHL